MQIQTLDRSRRQRFRFEHGFDLAVCKNSAVKRVLLVERILETEARTQISGRNQLHAVRVGISGTFDENYIKRPVVELLIIVVCTVSLSPVSSECVVLGGLMNFHSDFLTPRNRHRISTISWECPPFIWRLTCLSKVTRRNSVYAKKGHVNMEMAHRYVVW